MQINTFLIRMQIQNAIIYTVRSTIYLTIYIIKMIHTFDNNDPETASIIKKVLNKKIISNSQTYRHHKHHDSNLVHKVNESLDNQNNSLRKQISKLERKIKKMAIFNEKNKLQEEKGKVQSLKKRIQKIETLNNKLSTRIISQSRAIKKIKDNQSQSQTKMINKYSTIKSNTQINRQTNQPTSPILQFSLYTLSQQNQSNTTLRQKAKIEKIKQNKDRKILKSIKQESVQIKLGKDKAIQVNISYEQNEQQKYQLKQERKRLQEIIRRNNLKLNLYQSKMQKIIL